MKHFTLASFAVERRVAAVALFRGTRLEDMNVRHLPIDASKAFGSVSELVTRTLEQYQPEFVAIHCPSTKAGDRIRVFSGHVKQIAHSLGIPTMEVDGQTLMVAYGHPPLSRREYVRRAARMIWPVLSTKVSKRAIVDAATAGLYVQTKRLFVPHEEEA